MYSGWKMEKKPERKTGEIVRIKRLDYDVNCQDCGLEIFRHFSKPTFRIGGHEGDIHKYSCPRCGIAITVHIGPLGVEGEDYTWEQVGPKDKKEWMN